MRIILLAALCSAAYGQTCGDTTGAGGGVFDGCDDGFEYDDTTAAIDTGLDNATCCKASACGVGNGTDPGTIVCDGTHGTVSGVTASCACDCNAGYEGADCATPSACGVGNGTDPGTIVCDGTHGTVSGTTGTCACDCNAGYEGADCATGSACAVGNGTDPGTIVCDDTNGTVAGTTGACTCGCADGFTGADCASAECTAGAATAGLEIVCDETHGVPGGVSGACTCTCGDGWEGADCATETVDPVCTCTGGTAATAADTCVVDGTEQCEGDCTARVEWKAEVLPVAAAAEDDDTTDIDETVEIEAAAEQAGVAGFHHPDEDDQTDALEALTCVADVCTCWDPAVVNADNLVDDAQDGLDADGKSVENTGTDDAPVWANGWKDGFHTIATGIWCPGNGVDKCVADPVLCGADFSCDDGWTVKADAATTEGETNAVCCTEDSSDPDTTDPDAEKEYECNCDDDAETTCADAKTEDDCTAAKGTWDEVKEAESEEDTSSAAMASAVVALVSLLL